MNVPWSANAVAIIWALLGLLTVLRMTQSTRIHRIYGMIRQPGAGRPLTRGGKRW